MLDVLTEVLNCGKPVRIKNNKFLSASEYINPFVESLSEYNPDYKIWTKTPTQMTCSEDGDDVFYARVAIEATLTNIAEHPIILGMVYGLDTRKPTVQFYKGWDCDGHLCAFNASHVVIQDIVPETEFDYSAISTLLDSEDESYNNVLKLMQTSFNMGNAYYNLGMWVHNAISCAFPSPFGKVKFSPADVITVYNNLFLNKDSKYLLSGAPSMLDVYKAFANIVNIGRNKDILHTYEKTLLISKIIDFTIEP